MDSVTAFKSFLEETIEKYGFMAFKHSMMICSDFNADYTSFEEPLLCYAM